MVETLTVTEVQTRRGGLQSVAWAVALLASLLPDILFRELTGTLPAWLFWAKAGLLAALLLAGLVWGRLRSLQLQPFFVILLAVQLISLAVGWFYQSIHYQTWLAGLNPFLTEMFSVQIPRFTTAALMLLVALALLGRFEHLFFVKGKLDAPAAPIPGITSRPTSWRILGPAVAGAMCLGLAVFTFAFSSLPSLQALGGALPYLPLVLLFAASNAFGEEMIYRAPWLGVLEGPVGPTQALLITAASFGIYHYYGVPYGLLGVGMAFIPGWLMGKAMLETRGFFWAWFIHFCMDAVIFFFIALGSVRPGG